jgi:trigger factor
MNITQERVDELNILIHVEITPEDYAAELEKGLKTMQVRANVPGFRAGKAPMGMIRKMYANSMRSDEVFKKLNAELYAFIEREKIRFLGEPLPSESHPDVNDWTADGLFRFAFELGLMPAAEVHIPAKNELKAFKITVSDAEVEKEIERLRKGQPSFQEREELSEEDSVFGSFTHSLEGQEEPTTTSCFFPLAKLELDEAKQALLNKKPGDVVSLPTQGLFGDAHSGSIYLNLPEADLEALPETVEFTITSISRMAPAELNQRFFDSIFGEGQVSDEEQMRERIRQSLQGNLQSSANQELLTGLREWLIDSNPMELPEAFLMRWLHAGQKKDKSLEEIQESFQKDRRYIVWEVLRTKLLGQHAVTVETPELMAECRSVVINRLMRAGYQFNESQLEDVVARFMKDKDEVLGIHENLLEFKVLEAVRQGMNIAETALDSEAYFELKKA